MTPFSTSQIFLNTCWNLCMYFLINPIVSSICIFQPLIPWALQCYGHSLWTPSSFTPLDTSNNHELIHINLVHLPHARPSVSLCWRKLKITLFSKRKKIITTSSYRFPIYGRFQTFTQTYQKTLLSCIIAIHNSIAIRPHEHIGKKCCINKWLWRVFMDPNFLSNICFGKNAP
jgi:hypothetical protein